MAGSNRHYVFTKFFEDAPDLQLTGSDVAIFTLQILPDCFPEDQWVRYVVAQAETSPETGRVHWQGYIELKAKMGIRLLQQRVPFLVGAHLEPRRGTRDEARNYCMKEATRAAPPMEHGQWEAGGQGARTDVSGLASMVMEGASNHEIASSMPDLFLRNHVGINALRSALANKPTEDVDFAPRKWQKDLMEILAGPVHDRHIYWIYDSVGGAGKSRLAKHLKIEHGAIELNGKGNDMAYAYNGQRIVLFDIARAASENLKHLAIFAEQLKNGSLFSSKYTSQEKNFNPPHVVFFSNVMPPEGLWSADRLQLVDLDEERRQLRRERTTQLAAAATVDGGNRQAVAGPVDPTGPSGFAGRPYM